MKLNSSSITKFILSSILFFVFSLIANKSWATHIRAAQIEIERISTSTLTYRFTMTAIRDSGGGQVRFGLGNFSFGDGRVIENVRGIADDEDIAGIPIEDRIIKRFDVIDLGNDQELNIFVVEHTYPSASPSYIVGYQEENRNEGILNIGNSVNTAFYIESQVRIDPIFGINNSPVLTVLPIDMGGQFVQFSHNPGAFDPDGDSLSYILTTPMQAPGADVLNYRNPNSPEFYSDFSRGNEAQSDPPTFELDPITGTLTWDAPDQPGEYNVAFVVEEWRKIGGRFFRLGFVTRDMQIIIEPTDNERPLLEVPQDLCVVAGTRIDEVIRGSDPDGHDVLIEAFGGPFELTPSAQFSPNEFQDEPAFINFSWQTDCAHVRERPYEVILKITDRPAFGPMLVSFETWRIMVIGPPPTGLVANQVNSEVIDLSWDPYTCSQADSMQVWRRVDSFDFEPDSCEVGIPPFGGYQLIDQVRINTNDYRDDNNGRGLAPGATYCYRLVATYPEPGAGISVVSAEACDSIAAIAPIITNVDIESTSETDGEIIVRWQPPFDADPSIPRPFQYNVLRSELNAAFESIATLSDLTLLDRGLNTLNTIYNYQIVAIDANGVVLDTSAVAGSVDLDPTPLFQSIELDWSANVPWSNVAQDFPYHYIYRDNVSTDEEELVLIDSVDVTQGNFFYLDDGRFNGETLDDRIEYCYFVTTQGVYGNEMVDEPLINRSQIICANPNDIIPPCTPVAFRFDQDLTCEERISDQICSFENFFNLITWERDESEGCDDDISSFNVFFSPTGLGEDFELVANVFGTEFLHDGLPSFKGCYRVSSVDRSGNESGLSETICIDNCPNYELPNAFSPNTDDVNNVFTPFFESLDNQIPRFENSRCPRFVKRVVFTVFDRTGNELFRHDSEEDPENGILINWDGNTANGNQLPTGTYFYLANVTFDVNDESQRNQLIRGWVQLFR